MRRALLLVGPLAVLAAVLATTFSGAGFTSQSVNAGSVFTANWNSGTPGLRLFSQSTDPDGLTAFAVQAGSSPAVLVATGVDATLAADLGGGSKSVYGTNTDLFRVATLRAEQAMTVAISDNDPAGFIRAVGISSLTPGGSIGGTSGVALAAGARAQINLTVNTKNVPANKTLTAGIVLTFTPAGGTQQTVTFTAKVMT